MDDKKTFVSDLVKRLSSKEYLVDSSESVSWLAYREAEKLNDLKLFPYFKDFLETEKDTDIRRTIYFPIASIGGHNNEPKILNYLISRIGLEKTRWSKSTILNNTWQFYKENTIGLHPEFEKLIYNKSWQIVWPTLDLLGICKQKEEAEKIIDEYLKSDIKKDKYILDEALTALLNVGSKKSYHWFEDYLDFGFNDMVGACVAGIAKFGDDGMGRMREILLNHRNGWAKSCALSSVLRLGGKNELESVLKYVKKQQKKPSIYYLHDKEAIDEFIRKYSD
ncbi:MAG: hypothetical protein WCK98_03275 [bacterium]